MRDTGREYHIEALVEDRSGGMVLAGLLEKMLLELPRQAPRWSVSIRPHRGVGKLPSESEREPEPFTANLLGLLPAKLRAYDSLLPPEGPDLVLIVCDSDDKDSRSFFNQIRRCAESVAPVLPSIVGLAVEELESWMLADREALQMAYPEINFQLLDGYIQDSVCGTWEVLARALLGEKAEQLIEAGYPAVGMYKAEWAAKIAPYLEPSRNRSPSFQRFAKILRRFLAQPLDRLSEIRRETQFAAYDRRAYHGEAAENGFGSGDGCSGGDGREQ